LRETKIFPTCYRPLDPTPMVASSSPFLPTSELLKIQRSSRYMISTHVAGGNPVTVRVRL